MNKDTQNKMQLYAGAAKRKLDYPDNFFPHKGFRGRYFTGIHDELYVRTLYVACGDTAALVVSLELGDIGRQWLEEIGAAVDLPVENIFLTVSHTHSAPHIDSTWKEDVIDTEMGEKFAAMCRETVIAGARAAKASARPAWMQFDVGSCDINCNRDYLHRGKFVQAPNPFGPSDKTVAVMKFSDKASGKTIAYLTNYAIHSLVTFYQTWTYEDSMLISGDLAGAAMRYVEERSDEDTVCLFLLGASGDQMPRYIANHRSFEVDGAVTWHYEGREAAHAMCAVQATPLAMEILRVGETMRCGAANAAVSTTAVRVTSMGKIEGMRTSAKVGEEHKAGNDYTAQYKEIALPDFQYVPTEPITMQLGLLRIGDVSFVTVPAEIVCSIGARMRAAVQQRLGGKAVAVSQCNGAFSYITDDEGYRCMTFEALSSHFMPGIAACLESGAADMAEQLLRGAGSDI